jgi:hypothetical protein
MLRTIACRCIALLVLLHPSPAAQQADSGIVHVTVEEPMGPVEGVLIRAARRSTTTDGSGNARLTLPTGRQQLSFARIGYQAKRITVLVVRDSVVPTRWSGPRRRRGVAGPPRCGRRWKASWPMWRCAIAGKTSTS